MLGGGVSSLNSPLVLFKQINWSAMVTIHLPLYYIIATVHYNDYCTIAKVLYTHHCAIIPLVDGGHYFSLPTRSSL